MELSIRNASSGDEAFAVAPITGRECCKPSLHSHAPVGNGATLFFLDVCDQGLGREHEATGRFVISCAQARLTWAEKMKKF